MTEKEKELRSLIEDIYSQMREEREPENIKVELKRQWPNLSKSISGKKRKKNISKFIKELVALANTYGPHNGYLIIGFSEQGEVVNSPFSKSGLKDKSELYNLVVRYIDKPIRFESHEVITKIDDNKKIVSVITVPPSLDKPHVIKEFTTDKQTITNYIPVKKDTLIYPATRTDLDIMYYDRGNIVPEYAISIISPSSIIHVQKDVVYSILTLPVIFENYGRKPIILNKCNLILLPIYLPYQNFRLEEMHKFSLREYRVEDGVVGESLFRNRPIIIPSNNAVTYVCVFCNKNEIFAEKLGGVNFRYVIEAIDVNGKNYQSTEYTRGK